MNHILSSRVREISFEGKPCTGPLATNQGMIGIFSSAEKHHFKEYFNINYKQKLLEVISKAV